MPKPKSVKDQREVVRSGTCANEKNHYHLPMNIEEYVKRSLTGRIGVAVEELEPPIIGVKCLSCSYITVIETDVLDHARWVKTRLRLLGAEAANSVV